MAFFLREDLDRCCSLPKKATSAETTSWASAGKALKSCKIRAWFITIASVFDIHSTRAAGKVLVCIIGQKLSIFDICQAHIEAKTLKNRT